MAFSETVRNITYHEILPTIVDAVNNSNILTARVMSNTKEWHGKNITQPIQVANSTTGKSFDGLDTFDTSTTDNVRVLKWYPKNYVQPIAISGIEKSVNQSSNDKQAISLIGAKMDEAKNSIIDALGTLLYGQGIGKDIEGLGLIVDNGTNSSEYGGLARTVAGNSADVTAAAGGNITLDLVSAEHSAVSATGISKESPTLGLTTGAVWDLFEKILNTKLSVNYDATNVKGYNVVTGNTPNGRMISGTEIGAAAGFTAISYRSKPVVADDKCTAGTFFWLNENYLEFRRLKLADLKTVDSSNKVTEGASKEQNRPTFLQYRDFLQPINQYGEIGALFVSGNYICRQPRRQGKITGITKASF